MPSISDILDSPRRKRFKKKSYRPWNDDGESLNEDAVSDDSVISKFNAEQKDKNSVSSIERKNHKVEKTTSKENKKSSREAEKEVGRTASKNINKGNDKDNNKSVSKSNNKDNNKSNDVSNNLNLTSKKTVNPSSDNFSVVGDLILRDANKIRVLYGHQKKLFFLIVRLCIENEQVVTEPLTREQLQKEVDASIGTIKTSIRRLEKKGLIKSVSKRARGGFFRFAISEKLKNIAEEILRN
jgi:hypothetical protein